MLRKIIGVMFLIVSISGFVVFFNPDELAAVNIGSQVCAVITTTAIGLYLLLTRGKTLEEKEAARIKKQDEKERLKKQRIEERIPRVIAGEHMAGIEGLATGIPCDLSFREDCLFIEGGGCSFRLSYDKAIDIVQTTDKEIQKSYVSSVGGAVGGAALFGTLGAMVGGRSKEKTSTVTEFYLVVTYNKDNKLAYLSFHVPPEQNGFFMSQIIDYHRNRFTGKIETREL